jgi:hypothetical protein
VAHKERVSAEVATTAVGGAQRFEGPTQGRGLMVFLGVILIGVLLFLLLAAILCRSEPFNDVRSRRSQHNPAA